MGNKKYPNKANNMHPVTMSIDEPDSERAKKKAAIFNKLWRIKNKRGIAKFNDTSEMEFLIEQYFEDCAEEGIRPTIRGLASALGTTYTSLFDWENGSRDATLGPECSKLVKNAKAFIAEYDEQMAVEGLDNPVLYMFRSKNYYGMKDTQDVSVVSKNPLGDSIRPEDIVKSIPQDIPIDVEGTEKIE